MRYQVLQPFRVKTSQGEREILPGQIITIPREKALKLLNEGKIIAIKKIAYKLYSEILQAYLWVVETKQDMHSLRAQGIAEAVYTSNDIQTLKGIDKEELKVIHRVKEVFPESTVENVCPKEETNERKRAKTDSKAK